MGFFVLIFLVLAFFALRPTESGKNLRTQAERVEVIMNAAVAKRGIPFEMRVLRDSWISSVGHDLAVFLSSKTMKEARPAARLLVADLHAPGVLSAVSHKLLGKCTVFASGESVKEGFPMASLVAAMGDETLAWNVGLLHESAHCVRNPAAERLEHLKASAWREESPQSNLLFSLYLSESYADAYAILMLGVLDPAADVQDVAHRLIALRRSSSSGPSHRTEAAIQAAADVVATQAHRLKEWQPEDFDRAALRSAMHGGSTWFRFMQIEPEQIASGFLQSLQRAATGPSIAKGSSDV